MPIIDCPESELVFQPLPTSKQFIDITGQDFHMLTALGYAGKVKTKHLYFFRCDCGRITKIPKSQAVTGNTTSCGCNKYRSGTQHPGYKHGNSINYKYSSEYHSWASMKKRCNNKNTEKYHCYGGRGIKVCDRWQNSFSAFLEDMGLKPHPSYSLDRRLNDQNYEPENCRWANKITQANNTRYNTLLTINNETKTLAKWCGGCETTLYKRTRTRLYKGWCAPCALTIESRKGTCPHKTIS